MNILKFVAALALALMGVASAQSQSFPNASHHH